MNDVAGDAADRAPIAGSRVLIAAHGLALAAPLARGLERLGAKVACLDANCASRGEWDDAVQAATRDLGGLTGDTYGALCEIAEVVTLAVLSAEF